jgi:hypothetical protein
MTSEPDLASLILDAKGDRSYERMSTDCGGLPTDKRLQQMATTPLKAFPDVATIRGLARGAGTTITAVVLAAARSLGLQVHTAEDPDALTIGGAGELRPDQKDAIRALVRVFREANLQAQADAFHNALDRSNERWLATRNVVEHVPLDGPNRAKERDLVLRSAVAARDELDQAMAATPTDAGMAILWDHAKISRRQWDELIDGLTAMTKKYPPASDEEHTNADRLPRALVYLSTGSGKTDAAVRNSLDLMFLRDGVLVAADSTHEDDDQDPIKVSHHGDTSAKRRRGKASPGGDPKTTRDDDERAELAQAAYDSPEPAGIPESGAP